MTWPSSVARQGTIAGTHVRSAATQRGPKRTGENHRACWASSQVGQRAAGSGCRTRAGAPSRRPRSQLPRGRAGGPGSGPPGPAAEASRGVRWLTA